MADSPDVQKGARNYPGIFQKALSQYIEGMDKAEEDETKIIQKEWQERGPPLDVQLRCVVLSFLPGNICDGLRAVKKYSRRGIINAHELLQKEMGVDCITFSWFPDPDTGVLGVVWSVFRFAVGTYCGQLTMSDSHDYISSFLAKTSGTKLKTFQEWNVKGYDRIVAETMGYAQYIQDHKKNEVGNDTLPINKPVSYKNGPDMLPVLPAEFKGVRGSEVAKSAKEIIRSYFQRHYCESRKHHQAHLVLISYVAMASTDENSKTPWTKIAEDPSKFFASDCYPEGFQFEDPSRMGKTVKVLLNHLRQKKNWA